MDQSLVKERLITEWHNATMTNGARATAVAVMSDEEMRVPISKKMKEVSTRISQIQKELETMAVSAEETAVFGEIARLREAYLQARGAVAALRKSGDEGGAKKMYLHVQEPALNAYLDSIGKLDDFQARQIVAFSDTLKCDNRFARIPMGSLSCAALLVGLLASAFITRSLTRQLGGEPVAVVRIAGRIAEGDLVVPVPLKGDD